MDKRKILAKLSGFAIRANQSNIEDVMKDVQDLLVTIPENFYYEISHDVEEILKPLNEMYIEKMKQAGKVVAISIEDLLGPSMN